jgi:hypothetical protein
MRLLLRHELAKPFDIRARRQRADDLVAQADQIVGSAGRRLIGRIHPLDDRPRRSWLAGG